MLEFLFGYGLLHDAVRLYGDTIWHSGEGNWDSDGTYKNMDGNLKWGENRQLCCYKRNEHDERVIGDLTRDIDYRNFDTEARLRRRHNAINNPDRTTYLFDERGRLAKYFYFPKMNRKIILYEDLITDEIFTVIYYKRKAMYLRVKDGIMIRPSDWQLFVDKKENIDNTDLYKNLIKEFNENRENLYPTIFKEYEINYKSLPERILYKESCSIEINFNEQAECEKDLSYKEFKELNPIYQEEFKKYKEEYKRKLKNGEITNVWC